MIHSPLSSVKISGGDFVMKCMNIAVFLFFLAFGNMGAEIIFDDGVRKKQNISSDVILVGALDMGLQTGSISNAVYTLQVGFLSQIKTQNVLGDFNGDGAVNFSDFLIFAVGFGRRLPDVEYNVQLDLNGDGEIGFSDFLIFALAFTG
jgi:hypothetical protein